MAIARDDAVLGGEPRIEGTRIGVRRVAARVADQLDISLASVYEALSYDDANLDEIRAIEDANDEAVERIRESSLTPSESVE